MKRRALTVLWPSFVSAALAEGVFFSLFDPEELTHLAGTGLSSKAVYSLGFFLFWTLCSLASMLTYYLIAVPADDRPPF